MTIATAKRMTLAEYLDYDDGTDTPHELVDGVLVEMGAESQLNLQIATFLLIHFASLGVPHYLLSNKTEIVVSSREATTRYPDLVVLTPELEAMMTGSYRAIVRSDMPPPQLVIEVVSPGQPGEENYDRDYIDKRQEYALRRILEYWIIDPMRGIVMVLKLNQTDYEAQTFEGKAVVVSPTFLALTLTAEQILRAGR